VVVDAFAFGESGLLREDLQFILMAMVVDMLVINFAMVYNSRLIERAAIQAQMDRERALYQQREDIGDDLHDDIGATMSSIQVYAGMAQKAMRQGSDPTQLEDLMKRVSSGVKSVSESINDVVWATSARAREGKSLSSRIKDFYVDVFDTKGIECTYDIDPDAEAGITDMLARKNLLMIAKEAINNAVKHSGAKRLKVSLRRENDKLRLFVEDDGKGLPETLSSLGNGFHSMSQRARRLGGDLRLSSTVDGGTRVECEIPMTRISD
jgi:signal transduction histidine kinase